MTTTKDFLQALPELVKNREQAIELLNNTDTRIQIADQMQMMGSFAGHICNAILVADSENLNVLSTAFSSLILQAWRASQ